MSALLAMERDEPTAPLLILMPGLDGTGELFDGLLNELGSDVRVATLGYPTHESLSYAGLRAQLERAIPAVGTYVLVAESFSGPLAIEFAASGPERLQGLVLCATFASNPLPQGLRCLRWLVMPWIFRVPVPSMFLRWLLLGREASSATCAELRSTLKSVRPAVLAERVRLTLEVDVRPLLSKVCCPVLYLVGKRDRLVGSRGVDSLAGGDLDLQTVVLDGPHLLLQAQPRESAAAILRFVRGTGG